MDLVLLGPELAELTVVAGDAGDLAPVEKKLDALASRNPGVANLSAAAA